eukprot:TRINITY_DN361_c0_g3_i10.p1 TRINITY_DN361_c0_g3~~TRINITY_DN361_c0_g3_i10.p1  ORF type:complete len:796 (-),score=343.77 TRINITY_DN361_c0_g3_i10:52-2439(-)
MTHNLSRSFDVSFHKMPREYDRVYPGVIDSDEERQSQNVMETLKQHKEQRRNHRGTTANYHSPRKAWGSSDVSSKYLHSDGHSTSRSQGQRTPRMEQQDEEGERWAEDLDDTDKTISRLEHQISKLKRERDQLRWSVASSNNSRLWDQFEQKVPAVVESKPAPSYQDSQAALHNSQSEEEFFRALHTLKSEHAKNLKRIEKMYYESKEYPHEKTKISEKLQAKKNFSEREKMIEKALSSSAMRTSLPEAISDKYHYVQDEDEEDEGENGRGYRSDEEYGNYSDNNDDDDDDDDPYGRRKRYGRSGTRARPQSASAASIDRKYRGKGDGTFGNSYKFKGYKTRRFDKMGRDELPEALRNSYDSKYFEMQQARKKKERQRPKITIPKPFSFEERENNRKKSLQQIKFEEDIRRKKEEEEALLNYKFRAEPVPESSIVPKYYQMMDEMENRRRENKRMSFEITKSREKPFSFYERDLEMEKDKNETLKRLRKEREQMEAEELRKRNFQANRIPKHVSEPRFELMQMEEEERKQRINKMAQERLRQASLPPRMEMWEHTQQTKVKKEEGPSFKPQINETVLDFDKLHKEFANELAQKKQQFRQTEIKEFSLRVEKNMDERRAKRERKKQQEELDAYLREEEEKKKKQAMIERLNRTSKEPKYTKMTLFKIEEAKRKKEEEELKKLEEEEAKRAEKEKKRALNAKVSASLYDTRKDLELRKEQQRQQKMQQRRELEEEYKEQLRTMKEKVDSRPLLLKQMEIDNEKKQAQERYNAKIRASGIDFQEYLKEEEDSMMRDFN